MRLVKGDLRKLKAAQLVDKSAYVEEKMTGNPNFTTPTPSIPSITAARTALSVALRAAESGAHADIVAKNNAHVALRTLLSDLVRYVNSASAGDEDKAVSSGFELAKRPEPVDRLNPPAFVKALVSSYIGSVDLRWHGVHGARMYQVYMTAGDPSLETGWELVGVSSRTKHTVGELDPGKFYNFRVTALGRVGEGPASENVGSRAA